MKTKINERGKSENSYPKIVKSFLGFLEGTGKSSSTVASYRYDLQCFEEFLKFRQKNFFAVNAKDFGAYLIWMEKEGFRINTKRRKFLSAKALVRYAVSRKKMPDRAVQFTKSPERLERLPWIPNSVQVQEVVARCSAESALGARNRLILELLSDTGMLVAELCSLRWEDWDGEILHVTGKKPRSLRISEISLELMKKWAQHHAGKFIFPGYNRYGMQTEKMTSRGLELFVHHVATAAGMPQLKPKSLRHHAILRWIAEDQSDQEIQKRLGVHKNYSLQSYRKYLERHP